MRPVFNSLNLTPYNIGYRPAAGKKGFGGYAPPIQLAAGAPHELLGWGRVLIIISKIRHMHNYYLMNQRYTLFVLFSFFLHSIIVRLRRALWGLRPQTPVRLRRLLRITRLAAGEWADEEYILLINSPQAHATHE